MKHHISLVGGQLLPILVGIKEFNPDVVHLVMSKEIKDKISPLKDCLSGISIHEIACSPYNFYEIIDTLRDKAASISSEDEVVVNVTGGTKIMLLACQIAFSEFHWKFIYINQDNSYLDFTSGSLFPIKTSISITDLCAISGHELSNSKKVTDFPEEDLNASIKILEFSTHPYYSAIMKYIKVNYKNIKKSIPKTGYFEIPKMCLKVEWNSKSFSVHEKRNLIHLESLNVYKLFFFSEWWELIIGSEVQKWCSNSEMLMQVTLPFKHNKKAPKNEIDVLVSLNNRLLFVECKSGEVKQEDVNKIRVIHDLYGGTVSKAILVSLFKPDERIIEKCSELSIATYYHSENGVLKSDFSQLFQTLNHLINSNSV